MHNKKSSNHWNVFRGVSLMLSVLTLSLAVNYFASAWTEPSATPPGGNASAPLNVSFTDQSKEGRIGIGGVFAPLYSLDIRDSIGLGTLRTTGGAILNTGGAATGLIVQNGNVGIGTTTPRAILHVVGDEVLIEEGSPEINFIDSTVGDINWRIGGGTGSYLGISAQDEADWNNTLGWGIVARYTGAGNVNVGIGTNGPGAKLDVRGNVKIGNDPVQANKALCWMVDKTIGYCSTQPDATGSCACNAIN